MALSVFELQVPIRQRTLAEGLRMGRVQRDAHAGHAAAVPEPVVNHIGACGLNSGDLRYDVDETWLHDG